ncbi:MAG: peroxidase family protein, partial [Planctomycetota bacterium]
VREHNHWATQIALDDPALTGDEIYERARAIVAAEMQAITYNEFLPLLLGADALPEYTGYKADVNPSIANVFATAGYRVGHTMLSSTLRRLDHNMQEAGEQDIPLLQAFFNPSEITSHGIESVLRGLAAQPAQDIDHLVIDDVRNFLFGQPGSGGFDLASLNIQRGRDHGLPSYNAIRQHFGLAAVTTFNEMNATQDVITRFSSVYASTNDFDSWIGLLCEQHVPGAMVGETLHAILVDQFTRLRDGDRFWYTEYLPQDMVDMINAQTLSVIIQRNTDIGPEISPTVFIAPPPCPGDFDGNESVGLTDFQVLASNFGMVSGADPNMGDMNGDGAVTLIDFRLFAARFGSSCGLD